MTADDDDRVEEDRDVVDAEDAEAEEDEFSEGEDVAPDLAEFDDDASLEDGESDGLAVVEEELTSKEQSARSLEIRRAIEQRMEERQFHEDLDYLDLDLDD